VSSQTEPRHHDIDRSEHAVAQYHGRSRPALAAACTELAQRVERGDIQRDPPSWTRTAAGRPFYVVIADALAAHNGAGLAPSVWDTTNLTGRRRADRARRKSRRASAESARRRVSL
jgi:hypothetical protein